MGCVVIKQPMSKINYSEKIDPAIYGEATKGFTKEDWIELAIAALDQAGVSAEGQRLIRERSGRDEFIQLCNFIG